MGKPLAVNDTPLGANRKGGRMEGDPAYDAAAGMPTGMPGSEPYADNARGARVVVPPPAQQKSPFGGSK